MTIYKHLTPVSFVAFSGSGELLATGDDAGYVFIWSLASGQLFQSLPRCSAEAISACWGDDKEFFLGSGNGELQFFEHVSAQNRFHRSHQFFVDANRAHITSVAVHSNRVVCCAGNNIFCYRIEGPKLVKRFSYSMTGVRQVRTVHFVDRQTLLATTITEGECVLLDLLEPSRPLWRRTLPHRIGEATVSADGRYLAVTTLASSVRIYEISATGPNLLHNFFAPSRPASNFPLQICFAESQALVVAGTDTGLINVWDLNSEMLTALQHSTADDGSDGSNLYLAQVVAARSTHEHHLIASACSEPSKVTVKVWKRSRKGNVQFPSGVKITIVVVLFAVAFGAMQAWTPYRINWRPLLATLHLGHVEYY